MPNAEKTWPAIVVAALLPAPSLLAAPGAGVGGSTVLVTSVEASAVPVTVETVATVDIGTGGISLDDAGNVYSSDFGAVLGDPSTAGTKVVRITPDGSPTVFAEGLEGASGSAFDSAGNLFQSNIRGSYVSRITPEGEVTTFVSEGIRGPVGIVIDDQDTLFVANCGGNSIQKVTKTGESTRFAESPLLKCPNGIARDERSHLYVANFYNGDVLEITPDGEVRRLATLPGNNNGHLVYSGGVLYVVARTAHQIYRVSLEGEITLLAGSGEKGGQDGAGDEASFCYPNDIDATPDGRVLYLNEVADTSSEGRKLGPTRIRRIVIGGDD